MNEGERDVQTLRIGRMKAEVVSVRVRPVVLILPL